MPEPRQQESTALVDAITAAVERLAERDDASEKLAVLEPFVRTLESIDLSQLEPLGSFLRRLE